MTNIFTEESNVRYYSRIFPAIFGRAKNSTMFDSLNNPYIDFFAGAGTLNYGHNNDLFKQKIIDYIQHDGIIHSLDMMTEARAEMIANFQQFILKKRGLDYKIQFTSPAGTDAIEAALKLARKYTKRKNILYFSNSYHGMSMGALSVTPKKDRIGIPVGYSVELPFFKENSPTNYDLGKYLTSLKESELPAAIILETVQAEGGINVASEEWLQYIAQTANKYGILLIIDDIQVGVGRTGDFFSFERAKITPDIVCLSKSLSGFGFPLATLLIRPEIDIWEVGEHTGTFRGFNLAFLGCNESILAYWKDEKFSEQIKKTSSFFRDKLDKICTPRNYQVYGIGMIFGIDVLDEELASKLKTECFKKGLIFETCGPEKSVIKMIPPLNITIEDLEKGLEIFLNALNSN